MPMQATTGAAYGWRARIGFITPSPTVENNAYEFYLMAPSGVTFLATSLGVLGLTQEQYDQGLSRLGFAVEELTRRRVDAIVQAGVPLVVTRGWGFEPTLLEEIHQQTDVPAVTDIGASIAAMQALGLERVAMLSPFADELQRQIVDYVAQAGIRVVATASLLDTLAFDEIGSAPLSVVYQAGRRLAGGVLAQIDGLWITGAYMPSVGIIGSLERDLGLPVVTAMQAMTWAALRAVGVDTTIEGYGRLLSLR